MTIFNVSLFLPYTVNFHLPNQSRPSSPSGGRADPLNLSSELYKKGSFTRKKASSISRPGSSSNRANSNRATPSSSRRPSSSNDWQGDDASSIADIAKSGPSLVPSEFDLSEWGSKGPYTQPAPQTTPAPSASILGEEAVLGESQLRQLATSEGKPSVRFHEEEQQQHQQDQQQQPLFSYADWTLEPSQFGNGGLKNAVNSAIDEGYLKDQLWVGTLGMPTDALSDQLKEDISDELAADYDALTVFVDDCDFDGHYLHFCKTILWPVFHYQIPDNPKSKAYEDHSWIYYVRVNQAFADLIVKNWKRDDVILVHDYHLLLVPSMVREKIPDAQIGFFLHIAFPSSEVFRCLAVRKEILQGMLGANLIGFQSAEYCHHFLQTCNILLKAEANNDGVQLESRFVDVGTFPIGIDPKSLEKRRRQSDVRQFISELKKKYEGKRLIVARDKLDNIRGVRQKLLAYELFLNKYPKWRNQVVLLQVALTTAEQPELQAVVTDIASRVNSVHSSLSHQPLVFLRQDISFPQFLALISVADLLMVTSLREGMNLTSHEFIYCQDGAISKDTKHAPLILSEFTGSASLFDGGPFLVNPWNYHAVADAINDAMEMSSEEREKRWTILNQTVTQHTAANWFKSFTKSLKKAYVEQAQRDNLSIPRLDMHSLFRDYQSSARRLFVLDYEGTMASWGSPRNVVMTTPQRAISVLNNLLEDPRNVVYLMSSRMPEEMERMFRQVAGLGLIAENGCFIREHNSDAWTKLIDDEKTRSWKEGVADMIEYFRDRTEGSWVEDRLASLVFRYANCEDREAAGRHGAECAANINETCGGMGIHAINVDGMMIAKPINPNKGTAASLVYERIQREVQKGPEGVDFLFVVGDGRDDEVVFKWANGLGEEGRVKVVKTVKLGLQNSEAMATMTQGVTGEYICID
ncbi:hypothetical protein KEM54_003352 [Ascosphaera aggregata]|nr:hypothetical protein KEM54_003352 [Ascosphaera aggregata]